MSDSPKLALGQDAMAWLASIGQPQVATAELSTAAVKSAPGSVGDTIGLLVDTHAGSLEVYRNGSRLGTMVAPGGLWRDSDSVSKPGLCTYTHFD